MGIGYGLCYVFYRAKRRGLDVETRKAIDHLLAQGCDVEKYRYRLYPRPARDKTVEYVILNFNDSSDLMGEETFADRVSAVERFAALAGLDQ